MTASHNEGRFLGKSVAVATIFGVLLGWLSAGAILIADRANAFGRIETNEAVRLDHEERLRRLESAVGGMQSDVQWIRSYLEKRTP